MLLENGAMIKQDVIDAFNNAVANPENLYENGGVNWDFVDADLNLDLNGVYATDYLFECFGVLVDNYFEA